MTVYRNDLEALEARRAALASAALATRHELDEVTRLVDEARPAAPRSPVRGSDDRAVVRADGPRSGARRWRRGVVAVAAAALLAGGGFALGSAGRARPAGGAAAVGADGDAAVGRDHAVRAADRDACARLEEAERRRREGTCDASIRATYRTTELDRASTTMAELETSNANLMIELAEVTDARDRLRVARRVALARTQAALAAAAAVGRARAAVVLDLEAARARNRELEAELARARADELAP